MASHLIRSTGSHGAEYVLIKMKLQTSLADFFAAGLFGFCGFFLHEEFIFHAIEEG